VLPPPVQLATLKETLIWHTRSNDDPGHKWVRGLMQEAGEELSRPL
jgi:hypothetical protein